MNYIKIYILSIIIFIFSYMSFGQNGWQQIYNKKANTFGYTLNNNFILAGAEFESMQQKWHVFQVDSIGNLEWDTIFYHGSFGLPQQIIATSDSGYLIAGFTNDNAYFIRFDKNNKKKWANQINFPDANVVAVNSVYSNSNNEYIAIGSAYSNGYYKTIIIKLNDPGICLWKKEYFEGIQTSGIDVAHGGNNEYFCLSNNGWDNSILFKINDDGDTIWSRHIDCEYLGASMIFTEDNCFIIRSQEFSSSIVFFKTDTNGNVLWTKKYRDNNYTYNNSQYMAKTFDGGYITTNFMYSVSNEEHLWLLKVNEQGDSIYSITSPVYLRPENIMQANDGMFIFLANDMNEIPRLIKTDSTGSIITTIKEKATEEVEGIICYPNPFNTYLNIDLSNNRDKGLICLYDMKGGIILSKQYQGDAPITFNLSNLKNGVYLVNILVGNNRYSSKIIKK